MLKFSDKAASEIVDVGMDFRALLSATGSIDYPTWSVTVERGADTAPTDILEGTTAILGTTAFARIHGGIAGVTYKIRCEVDADSGEHFMGEATMLVTA
jgi:hypothetical protein